MMNESETRLNDKDHNSRPETVVIINCVLNAPLMLISITGNTLVLAAILRTPSLHSPSFIFLCSLAFSDLLVGLIAQPLFVTRQITNVENSLLDGVRHMIAFSVCGASLCTMTAISLDRFMAIHYHLRYPSMVTVFRCICTLLTIWFSDLLLSVVYVWDSKTFYLILVAGIVTCVLICTFSYIRIYRIVLRHQFQIHNEQQALQISSNAGNFVNLMRLKKSALNTFVFYMFIIFCYLPNCVSLTIYSISLEKWTEAWFLTNTILFANSSFNPMLYCWRIRELRTAVLKLLKKVFLGQTMN